MREVVFTMDSAILNILPPSFKLESHYEDISSQSVWTEGTITANSFNVSIILRYKSSVVEPNKGNFAEARNCMLL